MSEQFFGRDEDEKSGANKTSGNKGDTVQRSIQLLPTGSNVKMWSKYGEMAINIEILYVSFIIRIERNNRHGVLVFNERVSYMRSFDNNNN